MAKTAIVTDGVLNSAIASLSVVRASDGTRVNSSGLIETISANLQRRDYDPVTKAVRGLLIEEARTNICTYSESSFATQWSATDVTVTDDDTTSPTGALNASSIVEGSTSNRHRIFKNLAKASSSINYSYSAYVKRVSGSRNIKIEMTGAVGSNSIYMYVNPGDGSIVSGPTAQGGFSNADGDILDAGNGYFRIWISGTSDASAFLTHLINQTDGTTDIYSGDGSSEIAVYGVQIESAALSPSSYISNPGSGSTTRAADVIKVSDLSDINFNFSEGGIFCKARAIDCDVSARAYDISAGSTASRLWDAYLLNNRFTVYGATTLSLNSSALAITNNVEFLAVGSYKENDLAAVVDGGVIVEDNSFSPLPTPDRFNIGTRYNGTGDFLNGHIRQLDYYDEALTDEELTLLSEGGSLGGRNTLIAVTRRTLKGPPKKRIYPKPKRGLFR